MIRRNNRGSVKFSQNTQEEWSSFRRGLNLLLQDFELEDEEFRLGTNLKLTGKGILTQRPGTADYTLLGSGKVRSIKGYYPKASGVSGALIGITDAGYFVKKNGTSYSVLPGASFASGANFSMAQLYNRMYITSKNYNLTKYDGTTLYPYAGLSTPTGLKLTKSSGTSGVFTFSYRISAESSTGETLACTAVTIANVPETLTTANYITVSWSAVSNAQGYCIYGQEGGNETFMTRVPSTSTSWIDDGNSLPSLFIFPPEADYTAGPKAEFLQTVNEKLVVYNLDESPSRLMWSGGGENVDKFHWSRGGGYVDISKDDGEEGTGHIEYENRIITFKERSIWQVTLTYNSTYGVVEPVKRRINGAVGCVAPKTICSVENDVFYVGRRAGGGISVNTIGYQENIAADTLRTAEVSAKIRPILEEVNSARLLEMWAIYYGNVYWLFFPVGASSMKCVGYDRERMAWIGTFDFPDAPSCGTVYYEQDGTERFLYGDGSDGKVTEISDGYSNDKGTSFDWTFQTKRGVAGDPFRLKNLIMTLVHLKNVQGNVSVNIYIEKSTGQTSTTKSFTVTKTITSAGMGSFRWGYSVAYGEDEQASTSDTNLVDVIKFVQVNAASIRSFYLTIEGSGIAQIVAVKSILTQLPEQYLPASWRA